MNCRTFAIGMLLVGMAMASSALAAEEDEVVAVADSSAWSLDTTLDDASTVVKVGRYGNPVPVVYSGNWWNPADSGAHSVRILVDGKQAATGLSGEGIWPCNLEVGGHTLECFIDSASYATRQLTVEGMDLEISVGGNWTCAITASVDDAVIYYTTDGSEPTRSSTVYTGVFIYDPEVETTVRAIAVADGYPDSEVKSKVLRACTVEEVVSAADSSDWSLDTRAGTEPLPLDCDAEIFYSALWSSDSGGTATVAVDGVRLFSASGEGAFTWPRPSKGGTYTLTHTTTKDGVQVGEVLTAQFVVPMLDFEIDDGTDGVGGSASSFSYNGVYDGKGHGIEVEVPADIVDPVVRYALDRNGEYVDELLFTNACDEVDVWYTIAAEGYNTYTNHATVSIAKATYDMTNVAWDYVEPFVYDGTVKRVALVGLPEGVTAKYAGNEQTEAGEYVARASLVYDAANYQAPAEIPECHWTIEPPPEVPGGNDDPVPPGGNDDPTPSGGNDDPVPPGGNDDPIPSGGDDEPTPPGGNDDPVPPGSGRCTVTFDAGLGVCEDCHEGGLYAAGAIYEVPIPTRPGYNFGGWYSSLDYRFPLMTMGGNTFSPDGSMKLYAKWERRRLCGSESTFNPTAAEVYQGYLLDANETVAGTIELKVGKPNKSGVSKVTATIQCLGAKKETAKGTTADGSFTTTTKSGRQLNLRIGMDGVFGTCGDCEVDGARNGFKAKDADAKAMAELALRRWQGVYALAVSTENGYAGISLEVGRKGAVKVVGAFPDGQKLSGKAQLLVGTRDCAIAVSCTKKTSSIAFLVWLCEDGTVECVDLSDPNWEVKIAAANAESQLLQGARFHVDGEAMAAKAQLPLLSGVLPEGVAVKLANNKFVVAKAGKVKLLRDQSGIDESKLGENPSALKLTYTSRNCTFKGSFTAYAIVDGKLKKYKASVTGVVLDAVGYGMAAIKGLGNFPVTIE